MSNTKRKAGVPFIERNCERSGGRPDLEAERFMKEYDKGKHQLPKRYKDALEKAKAEMFRKIRAILHAYDS